MLVREGTRVGWIEETQRKTMVCSVKEGSDRHHVSFSSPLTCSLLPFVLANASAFLCCLVLLASIAVLSVICLSYFACIAVGIMADTQSADGREGRKRARAARKEK
jgi:hypothetical protein